MSQLLVLCMVQAAILALQIITYFGSETLQHDLHDVSRPIDARIPLVPAAVSVYSLWFPLIALFPISLYFSQAENYPSYQMSYIICIAISIACYLIYPTTFVRPTPPDTFWGRRLKTIYKASFRGLNCAPSLHCSSSFMIAWVALTSFQMPPALRVLYIVVALGIVVSTMLTKQHTVLDVVTALPVAALSLVLGTLSAESFPMPI
ncbi:MAG: phosphatase PAP2 family protein [Varibaculum sp.]|nr:phosphatase PAP2 family protein [Varibaculum sp.]